MPLGTATHSCTSRIIETHTDEHYLAMTRELYLSLVRLPRVLYSYSLLVDACKKL